MNLGLTKPVAKFLLRRLPTGLITVLLMAFSFEFRNRMAGKGKNNQRIVSGPFKSGFAIESRWSGRQYIPAQIAGSYERELVSWITSAAPYDLVIDLGAAEGFYALNLLELDYCSQMVAFELDELSRDELRANADRLLRDTKTARLFLHGAATEAEIIKISREKQGGSNLLICDIEGAEFDLFTDVLTQNLNSFSIAIELHSHDEAKISNICAIIERTHSVQVLSRSVLDLSTLYDLFPDATELEIVNLAHEGRLSRQEWLLARPKTRDFSTVSSTLRPI